MIFPDKFKKRGNFTLHSGGVTTVFYDVNLMLTSRVELRRICRAVPRYFGSFVGIVTGGAIIASQFKRWAMVKDGVLKGLVSKRYCLIDDVCTTENSIKQAIKVIGRKPSTIFVVVDRRPIKERTIKIKSLYDVKRQSK